MVSGCMVCRGVTPSRLTGTAVAFVLALQTCLSGLVLCFGAGGHLAIEAPHPGHGPCNAAALDAHAPAYAGSRDHAWSVHRPGCVDIHFHVANAEAGARLSGQKNPRPWHLSCPSAATPHGSAHEHLFHDPHFQVVNLPCGQAKIPPSPSIPLRC
jgi:hypothetical protein